VIRVPLAAAPLALVAAGVLGAWASLGYVPWEAGGPGAGLMPGIASLALVVFAGIAAFEAPPAAGEPVHVPRLAGYVAGLAGFALLMGPLGAIPSIVALFAWTLGVVERWRWRTVAAIAAGAALFAWVLFDRLLSVPLPRGVFA
jgi:putative tricarboxylic transport membrane protein